MTAGKGDRVRPYNRKRWDEGWDRVFGKTPTPFFDRIKELDKILEKANKQYNERVNDGNNLERDDKAMGISIPKAPKENGD